MSQSKLKLVPIGECVEPIRTWNPARDSEEETFRYIDIGSVLQEEKTIQSNGEMPVADSPSRARQLVRFGDVLVSTVRPNLNAIAMVPEELDGATASTGFCVLRPCQNRLLGRYLFHWVRAPQFVADMVRQATGQNYPAVSDKIIKNSLIPLPPLSEQGRIAAILDQADALCRMRRKVVGRLDNLRQAVFCEIAGDTRTNPHGFQIESLGELLKVSSGEGLTAERMRSGPFPVYGGNGINGYHDEAIVGPSTIIIGRVGVYCGAVHVTESDAWVTDNALIVSKKRDINTRYLAAALQYANLNQYAGRSAQPLVSGSRIYPIEVILPPLEQQSRFARLDESLEEQGEKNFRSEKQLSELFSSLQQRAFRGKLS